jgi:hypothetical protein
MHDNCITRVTRGQGGPVLQKNDIPLPQP